MQRIIADYSRNLMEKIWSGSKSKNKLSLFLNEEQLQIFFCRIMHRGQKLELRLWRIEFLSWVPLGETGLVTRSVRLISSTFRWKTNMKAKKKKSKSNRKKSDSIGIGLSGLLWSRLLPVPSFRFFFFCAALERHSSRVSSISCLYDITAEVYDIAAVLCQVYHVYTILQQ